MSLAFRIDGNDSRKCNGAVLKSLVHKPRLRSFWEFRKKNKRVEITRKLIIFSITENLSTSFNSKNRVTKTIWPYRRLLWIPFFLGTV